MSPPRHIPEHFDMAKDDEGMLDTQAAPARPHASKVGQPI